MDFENQGQALSWYVIAWLEVNDCGGLNVKHETLSIVVE